MRPSGEEIQANKRKNPPTGVQVEERLDQVVIQLAGVQQAQDEGRQAALARRRHGVGPRHVQGPKHWWPGRLFFVFLLLLFLFFLVFVLLYL